MPHVPGAAQVLLNLAIAQRDAGRLGSACQALDEAQALLASLPEGAMPYASLDINQSIVQRDRGHFDAALEWFARALERLARQAPGWTPLLLAHRAQTWWALGQHARALQDLATADACAEAPLLARLHGAKVRVLVLRALGQSTAQARQRMSALVSVGGRALSLHRATLIDCIGLAPAQVLGLAGEVLEWAIACGRAGIEIGARARLIDAHLALAHTPQAARHARCIVALLADPDTGCDELYRGEAWLAAALGLQADAPTEATATVATALAWVDATAREHVALEFRDSFLHRNPANRELLGLAQRLGVAGRDITHF